MNVEHVFPQTYFDRALPMRSDLHHLMATFEHPNEMRGRLPFGPVPPAGLPGWAETEAARRGCRRAAGVKPDLRQD